MLVLSREVGESVTIEDVRLTLVLVRDDYVEVSLIKVAGGKSTLLTLPKNQHVDICYNVKVIFVTVTNTTKARLAFDGPRDIRIFRSEI